MLEAKSVLYRGHEEVNNLLLRVKSQNLYLSCLSLKAEKLQEASRFLCLDMITIQVTDWLHPDLSWGWFVEANQLALLFVQVVKIQSVQSFCVPGDQGV